MSSRQMKFGWFSLKHEQGLLGVLFHMWNPKWFYEQGYKFAKENAEMAPINNCRHTDIKCRGSIINCESCGYILSAEEYRQTMEKMNAEKLLE